MKRKNNRESGSSFIMLLIMISLLAFVVGAVMHVVGITIYDGFAYEAAGTVSGSHSPSMMVGL